VVGRDGFGRRVSALQTTCSIRLPVRWSSELRVRGAVPVAGDAVFELADPAAEGSSGLGQTFRAEEQQ
jgi:hypothetical protein